MAVNFRPDRGPGAVLFDLDGTLIESGPTWDDAVRHLLRGRGVTAGDELILGLHGMESMEAMRKVHRELGWAMDLVEANAAWVARTVAAAFRAEVVWRPGARTLLRTLHDARVPLALVTSSYRDIVDIVLGSLPAAAFDVVVCGDDVRSPKPHPEPYLTAVRLLGVKVEACVAIEDSVNGVASAKAAGCAVLYVNTRVPPPGVDAVRGTLLEVDLADLAGLVRPASTPLP